MRYLLDTRAFVWLATDDHSSIEHGIRIVDVAAEHAYIVGTLPFHHRDPFDRLLVAQVLHQKMTLVSQDSQLDAYPIDRVWS